MNSTIQFVSQATEGLLTAAFLRSEPSDQLEYRLATALIPDGLVIVREISEGGSVPELYLENRSDLPVFLCEGEILVGAKQNRTLDVSMLLAAGESTVIPVSCVEQGRWRHVSNTFSSSDDIAHPKLRSSKLTNLRSHLKQSSVWEEVSEQNTSHGTHSHTGSLSDVFAAKEEALRNFAKRLTPPVEANGLAIFLGGRLVSADLFHRHDIFAAIAPKLLRGAGLQSLVHQAPSVAAEPDLDGALAQVNEALTIGGELHPVPGIARLTILRGKQLSGFRLSKDDRVLHLAAFCN
jgi:hypothetical protein